MTPTHRHLRASLVAALLLACGPGNADDTSESSSTGGDAGPHADARWTWWLRSSGRV